MFRNSSEILLIAFLVISGLFIFQGAQAVNCANVPLSGNYEITASCTFDGTANGVELGNLTIKTGQTLTINTGQTIVWNPGYSVIIEKGSAVAINLAGGQLRKTYLWMTDADVDGYSPTSTQIASLSTPANGRRRKDMTTSTAFDYNDGDSYVYPEKNCSTATSSVTDDFYDTSKIAVSTDVMVKGGNLKIKNTCNGASNWTSCGGVKKCFGGNCYYWRYDNLLTEYIPLGNLGLTCILNGTPGTNHTGGADTSPNTGFYDLDCGSAYGALCYQYTCIGSEAPYYSSATSTSNNLLSGKNNVFSINSFSYTLSLPSGTAQVQFSTNSSVWYNSAGTLNGWDNMTAGTNNSINLLTLGWSGANFYYRIKFTTGDTTKTPLLDKVSVNYRSYSSLCSVNSLDGSCAKLEAGENSLPACQTCTGDSFEKVNFTDNTTDTEGSNQCTSGSGSVCLGGICKKNQAESCSGGSECASNYCSDGVCCNTACTDTCKSCNITGSVGTCTNVAANGLDSDTCTNCNSCDGSGKCIARTASGNDAISLGCNTGGDYRCTACSAGTCIKYTDMAQHGCSQCYGCSASGICLAPSLAQGAEATAMGCTVGSEGCRYCSYGNCNHYTSGLRLCPTCNPCNASGACTAIETRWGGGASYGCAAGSGDNMQRCVNDSGTGYCKMCSTGGGKMIRWEAEYSCDWCDNFDSVSGDPNTYNACAASNAYICWRKGSSGGTCTAACASHGGCVQEQWDDCSCAACLTWFPSAGCQSSFLCYAYHPGYYSTATRCDGRCSSDDHQNCDSSATNVTRMCICKW